MATLFMSPGIYVNEIDRSQYIQILTSTILAIVTPASKGEKDKATFVSSYAEMVSLFGNPSAQYPGLIVAREFFAAGGNQCWIVRVANGDAAAAFSLPLCDGTSVSVPAASSGSDMNNVTMNLSYANQKPKSYSTTLGLVLFDQETVTVGGTAKAGDVLNVTFTNAGIEDSPLTITYTLQSGDTLTTAATGLKNAINASVELAAANITATSASAVVTISAPTTLGSVTYGQSVGGTSPTTTLTLGVGSTNQPATQTHKVVLYNTDTNGETATLTGTVTPGDVISLTITNSGGISGSPVTVSHTALVGDTLTAIATSLAARINSNAALSSAGVTATAAGAVVTIDYWKSLGTVGFSSAVTGAQTETVTLGAVAGNVKNSPIVPSTLSMTINGSGGTVTDDGKGNLIFTPATSGISGTAWSGTINYNTGEMSITVTNVTVASTATLVPSFNFYSTFTMQFFYTMFNPVTGAVIHKFPVLGIQNLTPQNFQTGVNNTAYIGEVAGSQLTSFPKAGLYQFSGGDDGVSGLTDADYVGVQSPTPTGMQQFAFPDQVDINTIAIPGKGGSVAVRQALLQLVTESRRDTIALMAPPADATTAQEAVQWADGLGEWASFGVIDTSFAAIYFPHYTTFNPTNGAMEVTPPEAAAAIGFARSDWWEAPAGYVRGKLTNVTNIPQLNQGHRDFLYYNRINPISNLQNMGIMVAGQKTAVKVPSALDRVGARKVLSRLEKAIVTVSYPLLFELDSALTWKRAEDIIQPLLDSLLARGILRYGRVYCDKSSNTEETIKNNQMIVNIVLKLPKYAEFIVLNFIITENTSTINESLSGSNPFS